MDGVVLDSPSCCGSCAEEQQWHHRRHHTYPRVATNCLKQIRCDLVIDCADLVDRKNGAVTLERSTSRDVLLAWYKRVGSPANQAPADVIQPLFGDLHLYPCKTQVFEMLVCARQCARRKELTLTFAEFCIYVTEFRRLSQFSRSSSFKSKRDSSTPLIQSVSNNNSELLKPSIRSSSNCSENESPEYEVFLGGSCNPTTWRSDVAIPLLEKLGITYFNPQVPDWSSDLIEIEHKAKQTARVLFFVLDAETRAAAAAVEAAHLAATARSRLILVLQPYQRGQLIGGELVSDQEYVDLSRGQAILQEVAERRQLLVFNELEAALQCTQLLLRSKEDILSSPLFERSPWAPTIARHLIKLKQIFDSADKNKIGRLSLDETLILVRNLIKNTVTVQDLNNIITIYRATRNQSDATDILYPLFYTEYNQSFNSTNQKSEVDFETFCFILAELNAEITFNSDDVNLMSNENNPIIMSQNNSSKLSPSSIDFSQHEGKFVKWTEILKRCQRLVNRFQETVTNFLSKLEINSFSTKNDHQQFASNQYSFPKNGINGTSENSKLYYDTNNVSEHQHTVKSVNTNQSDSSFQSEDTNNSNNKQGNKKLNVIIPTLKDINDSKSAVLTPQSSKRFNNLANSIKDEIAFRDIYLGGSCSVRTTWRDRIVIPVLQKYNLSYYIPEINDYNRIFSAPPHTPMTETKFNFDKTSFSTYNDNYFNTSKSHENFHVDIKVVEDENIDKSYMTSSSKDNNFKDIEDRLSSNNRTSNENNRVSHKHERSPTSEDQFEKRPKYSRYESPLNDRCSSSSVNCETVELRNKSQSDLNHSHMSNNDRLSASDFYRISENMSPAPFRGMFDERQLWNSRILFFGVTQDTRCLAPMILAAHCIGLRPKDVVLCVQLLNHPEGLSEQAIKDYNRGRLYLIDLAKREGVPVFSNLEEATQCIIDKIKG